MASLSPSQLNPVIRTQFFSDTVSVIGSGIVEVTCVPVGEFDSGITISTTLSSVTISGRNLAQAYVDEGIWVEKGSSNLLENPKTSIGFTNIPPKKDLFELNQDLSADKEVFYTVTVKELVDPEDPMSEVTISNLSLSQTVRNDWSSGTLFLKEYMKDYVNGT
jgi:hypothetical protein